MLKMGRVWLLLIIPPILLAFIIMIVATYLSIINRSDRKAIHRGIVLSMPYILIINHAILFLILLAFIQADGISLSTIGWQFPSGQISIWSESLIGLVAGLLLFCLEHFILSPLRELAQKTIGGYQLHKSLAGNHYAWLIAVTIFAGVVEESIYRGYAISHLSLTMGTVWALVVSSVLFGPLHWGLGLWSMISTMITGALLGGIFIWRQTLLSPIIAHALLNFLVTVRPFRTSIK